jgi:hypothetical protein
MSKILVMHHVEKSWEHSYGTYGTDFDQVSLNLLNYIENTSFDRVILVMNCDDEIGDEHVNSGFSDHIQQVESYGYEWTRAEMEEGDPDGEDNNWAEGCYHSEVVILDQWIKDLAGHEVVVTGAFAGQCIETLTTAMDQCGVCYEEKLELIIGTGMTYDYLIDVDAEIDAIVEERQHFEEVDILDKSEVKENIKNLILSSENYEDFVSDLTESSFGFSQFDNYLVDEDVIAIKNEHSHLSIDRESIKRDQFKNIDVEFYNDKFWIKNSSDVEMFLNFKENNGDAIPIFVDSISEDPLAYPGITINNESQFNKVKIHLQKTTDKIKEESMGVIM